MATYILKTTADDTTTTRTFWCPDGGGYVREIDDDHPGTLGRQVAAADLSYCGDMMYSIPSTLAADIRAARRCELRAIRAMDNDY